MTGVDGDEVKVSGNYYDKDGVIVIKHGVEAGLGLVSVGIENSYNQGAPNRDENIKTSATVGSDGIGVNIEHNTSVTPQATPSSDTWGGHLDAGAKFKLLIGIEVKARIGVTHD